MDFLVSLFAYVGTLAGLATALLMAVTVYGTVPGARTIAQPAAMPAQNASTEAALDNQAMQRTSRLGRWGPPVLHATSEAMAAPQVKSAAHVRHKAPGTNEASREQLPRLFMQVRPNRWATQQESDFAGRYMGYVDEPSADQSRVR
jgi:hypothetical protein